MSPSNLKIFFSRRWPVDSTFEIRCPPSGCTVTVCNVLRVGIPAFDGSRADVFILYSYNSMNDIIKVNFVSTKVICNIVLVKKCCAYKLHLIAYVSWKYFAFDCTHHVQITKKWILIKKWKIKIKMNVGYIVNFSDCKILF